MLLATLGEGAVLTPSLTMCQEQAPPAEFILEPGEQWAASLGIEAYGHRIVIRASNLAAMDLVRGCLPPEWTSSPVAGVSCVYSLEIRESPVRGPHQLKIGSHLLAESLHLDVILHTLAGDLQRHIAEACTERVFVHAGVVGWQGGGLILPGVSYAGKSTLVDALVRAGATYYSDEFALFDATGRVHPYARPLRLRAGLETVSGRTNRAFTPVAVGTTPLPVGLVVFTRYREGARWRPRQLTPGRAVLALLGHTLPARRQPQRVLDTLRQVVMSAPAVSSARGDAARFADTLLDYYGRMKQERMT